MVKYIKINEDTRADDIPSIKEWEIGTVLNFDGYRDVKSFIVGPEYKLINNPDFSSSGYLSIPLAICSAILSDGYPNAVAFYNELANDTDTPSLSLQIAHNDRYLIDNYMQEFPSDWDITLWYSWGAFDYMEIAFPLSSGKRESRTFDEDATFDDIKAYADSLAHDLISFVIFVKKGDEDAEIKSKLPKTWQFESSSTLNTQNQLKKGYVNGSETSVSYILFYGPITDLTASIDAVNNVYKNSKIHGPWYKRAYVTGTRSSMDDSEPRPILHDELEYYLL